MHRASSPVRRKRYRQAVLLVALMVGFLVVVTVVTETLASDGSTSEAFPFPRRGPPAHAVGMIALDGDPDLVLDVIKNVESWSGIKRAFTSGKVSNEEIEELRQRLVQAGGLTQRGDVGVAHVPGTLTDGVLTFVISTEGPSVAGPPATRVSTSLPAPEVTRTVAPVVASSTTSTQAPAPLAEGNIAETTAAGGVARATEAPPSSEPPFVHATTGSVSGRVASVEAPIPGTVSVAVAAAAPALPFPRSGRPVHRVDKIVVQGDPGAVRLLTAATGKWDDIEKAVAVTLISDEEIAEIGRLLLRAGIQAGFPKTELAYYPKTLDRGVLTYRVSTGVSRPIAISASSLSAVAPSPAAEPPPQGGTTSRTAGAETTARPPVVERPRDERHAPSAGALTASRPPPTGTQAGPREAAAPAWRPPEIDRLLSRGQSGSHGRVATPPRVETAPPVTTVPAPVTTVGTPHVPHTQETAVSVASRPAEVDALLRRGMGGVTPSPTPPTPSVTVPVAVPDVTVPGTTPAVTVSTPTPGREAQTWRPPEVDQILGRGMSTATPPIPEKPVQAVRTEVLPEQPSVTVPDLPGAPEPPVPDMQTPMPGPAIKVTATKAEEGKRLWWPFARGTSPDEPIVTPVEAKPAPEQPRRWWPFTRRTDDPGADGEAVAISAGDIAAPVSVTVAAAPPQPVSITPIPQGPETVATVSVGTVAPESVTFPFPRSGTPRYAAGMIAINGDPDVVLRVLDYVDSWRDIKRAFTAVPVSSEEIDQLGRILLKAAEESGYVFVDVRHVPQTLSEGVLTYEVLPGTVGNVAVRGNRYYSGKQIMRHLDMEPNAPFNYKQFRDKVKAYSVKPDIKMDVTLDPKDVPGEGKAVNIGVAVEDSLPLHGGVELSSTHRALGDRRARAWLQHLNLTKADDELTVQATVDPSNTDEMEGTSGSYRRPIGRRHALTLYGGWAKSYLPEALPEMDVFGNGHFGGLRLSRLLKETPEYELSGSVEWSYQHSENRVHLVNIPYQKQDIALSMPKVTLNYADRGFDRFGGRNSASVSVLGNVAEFAGSSSEEEIASHMAEADGDILVARAEVARLQKLFNSPWSVFCRLDGQYSPCTLVPALQKAVGGADELRGYMEREVTGDSGVSGTLEFRTPLLRDFIPGLAGWRECGGGRPPRWRWHQLQFLTFVDFAYLHRNRALIGLDEDEWLASGGVGLRLGLTPYSNLSFDYGIPFQDTDETDRRGRSSVSLRLAF